MGDVGWADGLKAGVRKHLLEEGIFVGTALSITF